MQPYSGAMKLSFPSGISLSNLTLNSKPVGVGLENTLHSALAWMLSPEIRLLPQLVVGEQSGRLHISQGWIDSASIGSRHSRHAGEVSWFGPNAAG